MATDARKTACHKLCDCGHSRHHQWVAFAKMPEIGQELTLAIDRFRAGYWPGVGAASEAEDIFLDNSPLNVQRRVFTQEKVSGIGQVSQRKRAGRVTEPCFEMHLFG